MKILSYCILAFILLGVQKSNYTFIEGTFTVNYRNVYDYNEGTISIDKIEVSQPVLLYQYKNFLQAEKKEDFQFKPDFRPLITKYSSNFSIPTISWDNYFQSEKFDNYPVLGVTWEGAMEYCKWLNENSKDENYEFRLPNPVELIVYFQHFEKQQQLTHRFEWTVNSYNDGFGFDSDFKSIEWLFKLNYEARDEDPPSVKRKTIVSTTLINSLIRSNYQNCSDQFTSFRVVKALKNKNR